MYRATPGLRRALGGSRRALGYPLRLPAPVGAEADADAGRALVPAAPSRRMRRSGRGSAPRAPAQRRRSVRRAAAARRGSYNLPGRGIVGCGAAAECPRGGNNAARRCASAASAAEISTPKSAAHASAGRGPRRPRRSYETPQRLSLTEPAPASRPRSPQRGARPRRAAGIRRRRAVIVVDLVLERLRRAKHQDAARADRNLLAGLRIAADALPLLAHREAAERRDLDHLAARQRLANFADHRLDEFGGLVT